MAGLYHLVVYRGSWGYEDVIDPAAVVLVLLVVAVERVLPSRQGVQGVEANVSTVPLVLLVHLAAGEGGSIPWV